MGKTGSILLSIIFFATLIASAIAARVRSPILSYDEKCPASFNEWNKWRDDQFKDLSTPDDLATSDSSKIYETCEKVPEQSIFFNDPKFRACMQPLQQARKLLNSRIAEGGEAFYGLLPVLNTPPLDPTAHQLPKGLPEALNGIIRKLEARELNDPSVVAYMKEVLGSLPGSPEAFGFRSNLIDHKTLVLVYETPMGEKLIHLDGDAVIQLTIVRRDKDKEVSPPIVYFGHFQDTRTGKPTFYDSTERCITCHTTGIMPIVAKPGTMAYYGEKYSTETVLSWFNSTLAARSPIAKVQNYPSSDMPFPQFGEANPPQRTDAFMEKCIGTANVKIDRERIPALKSAMNCAECHDGQQVGKFSPYLRPAIFIRNNYILEDNLMTNGLMPPNARLSSDEKKALMACLRSEYYGGFKDPSLGGSTEPGTLIRELTRIKCPSDADPSTVYTQDFKRTDELPTKRPKKPTRETTPAI